MWWHVHGRGLQGQSHRQHLPNMHSSGGAYWLITCHRRPSCVHLISGSEGKQMSSEKRPAGGGDREGGMPGSHVVTQCCLLFVIIYIVPGTTPRLDLPLSSSNCFRSWLTCFWQACGNVMGEIKAHNQGRWSLGRRSPTSCQRWLAASQTACLTPIYILVRLPRSIPETFVTGKLRTCYGFVFMPCFSATFTMI